MIVCTTCGHRNADGSDFCGSCGTFLEWEREPAGPARTPTRDPNGPRAGTPVEPVATGDPTGAAGERRAPTVVPGDGPEEGSVTGGGPARAADEDGPAGHTTPAEAGTARTATTAGGSGTGTGAPTPDEPAGAGERSRPTGTIRRPDERPDRWSSPIPPTSPQSPPEPVVTGGNGRSCPGCGTENEPTRTFCRRCGRRLDEQVVVEERRLSWWRRLLRRLDRCLRPARREHLAGERPRRRLWRPNLVLPLVLVVLVAGGWYARPHLSRLTTYVRDQTARPEAVQPAAVRASSESSDHRAAAAFDGANNRYWSPRSNGSGQGEYLEVDFEQPVRLLKLVVWSGSSPNQDAFLARPRPAQFTVTLVSVDGGTTSRVIQLRDQAGQQTFDLRGFDVVRARITVDAAFGARDDQPIALAEVEFFRRR